MSNLVDYYKCRACDLVSERSELYKDPSNSFVLTCGNVFCGGVVDRLLDNSSERDQWDALTDEAIDNRRELWRRMSSQ